MPRIPQASSKATSDFNRRLDRRRYITNNIDQAIANGWIKVYYQPVVRSLTGEVCEFEALARWDDPVYGFLSPAEFVGVLEDARLVDKLDAYVVRRACKDWRRMHFEHAQSVALSVNLSRLDFELCDAFSMVEEPVHEFSVPRQMIHVEVTESALNNNAALLEREISRFRDAGYQVWLDDFGSGYSSLNTLKDYMFDVVKIDMAFLREFDSKPNSRVIIASIVNMSKQLGMQTLIEGVEEPAQFDFLHEIGCEFVQGYLVGKPMPMEENLRRVRSGELSIEHVALHGYYDRLGNVNTLSATPFDLPWDSEGEKPVAEMLPLAIIERASGKFHFMSVNEAFSNVLKAVGVESPAILARSIAEGSGIQGRTVRDTIEASRKSGSIETVDIVENGYHCVLRVRHLSSHGDVDAFLISLLSFSRYSNMGENQQLQIALRYMYSIYDIVHSIDVEENTLGTIYRGNTTFPSIPESTNVDDAIHAFVTAYVHVEDRESCEHFLDINTLSTRVASASGSYLAEAFRVMSLKGIYVWATIVVMPMVVDDSHMILMCIRRSNMSATTTISTGDAISKDLLWDTLIDLIPAGVFWKDADRRFLGVNKTFLDFYEFQSTNEVLGKNDEDMGWHVDTDPFKNNEFRVLAGEPVLNAKGTCIARGEVRNILASKIPLRRNGEVIGLLGYFHEDDPAGGNHSLKLSMERTIDSVDALTGIPNLTGLLSAAASYRGSYETHGIDFAFIVADIRGMSDLNDVYGHNFGNGVIKTVARVLARSCGVVGTAARIGGDKFAMLRQVRGPVDAQRSAEQFRSAVQGISEVDGLQIHLGCSLGMALFSECDDVNDALALADKRMREARKTH